MWIHIFAIFIRFTILFYFIVKCYKFFKTFCAITLVDGIITFKAFVMCIIYTQSYNITLKNSRKYRIFVYKIRIFL